MKKLLYAIPVLVIIAVAAYFLVFAKSGETAGTSDEGAQQSLLIAGAKPAKSSGRAAAASSAKRKIILQLPDGSIIEADEEDDDMSPEDRKRMDAISEAMEDDNFTAVTALIADVQTSTNAEVRSELVDALGSFGKKSLVELLPFMADPDPDVAESARDQWTMALGDVTSEKRKCKYIESAMSILTDEDALDSMMTELTDCDDRLAIQTIVNIVASGTPQAVAAAKEQYEFITGDEYTDIAAAEAWLQENYEPEEGNEE